MKIWQWIKSLFKKKQTPIPQEEPKKDTTPSQPEKPDAPVDLPKEEPGNIPGTIPGVLFTSGNKIMRDGKVFVFRGVNIPDPSYNDLKTWELDGVGTEFHVDNVIKKFPGINVIRLPILPGKKGGGEAWLGLGASKYFYNHLLPAMNYITSKGIYAIIDWHYLANWSGLEDETASFWEFFINEFATNEKIKNKDMLIFEIFNEPIDPRDWNSLRKKIMQPCIDIIRKHSNNLIIVGCPGWSSNIDEIDTLCTGENLAYTYHGYNNQWPELAKKRLLSFMSKHRAPLFVTELGWEPGTHENGTTNRYGRPYLDFIESYGLSWTAWCHSRMWDPRLIDHKSKTWELNESGVVVSEYIARNK